MAEPSSSLAPEPLQVTSSAADEPRGADELDADLRAFHDVVRSLPPEVVQDLLSLGICIRCILRLFGIQELVQSTPLPLSSIFSEHSSAPIKSQGAVVNVEVGEVEANKPPTSDESATKPVICSICLGILQFCCNIDAEFQVKMENQNHNHLARRIAELVKQEGHQIDSFSLEVSIPPIILENERKVWLYVKEKCGAQVWFQGRSITQCISLKDALKYIIVTPLENLLVAKLDKGNFSIRLTYTEPSKRIEDLNRGDPVSRQQKTGAANGLETIDESMSACKGGPDHTTRKETDVNQKSVNGLPDPETSDTIKLLEKKVLSPCFLSLHCSRNPTYFSGRYLKYSRNVSQTCWMIDDERKGEASVEEIIGSCILPLCGGDKSKFHAAGREDIDVRMLGSGRPFLIEIQNARHIPFEDTVKEIEANLNKSRGKLVKIKNLKVVGSEVWSQMREGEAEKQKQYAALVWISRPIEDDDLKNISSVKDLVILQRTPIRVLHRRSPLDREKIIHWMKIDRIAGTSQYFILHLCTQAGTYIKEFVHGDLGRTHPSIGSILRCRAEILQLDVTDVKMDSF